ncbi:hypothetical protein D3C71_1945690 [compost metagenome]
MRLVLAPSLLAVHGEAVLDAPERLAELPQLVHSRLERGNRWQLAGVEAAVFDPQGSPLLVADNASILRAFALQGAGVALLPD